MGSFVQAVVSVEEYLRTSYHPDCEYIDGELKEKPMPGDLHGMVQIMIGAWFKDHMRQWRVGAQSEVRTRVRPTRYRLPDVSVFRVPKQLTGTQNEPPLVAIEIQSEDDRLSDLQDRATDLRAMGVAHIWLIDPQRRIASVWLDEGYWKPEEDPRVAGTEVYLDLNWLWEQIDFLTGTSKA